MRNVKLLNGLLWGLNGLLGAGILVFAYFFLLFPRHVQNFKDFKVDESGGTVDRRPPSVVGEGALKGLSNPIVKVEAGTGAAPTLFKAVLKGTLPTEKDPKRAVAFIKSMARNVELVAYMEEEIFQDGKPYDEFRGWKLIEVSKDRAAFSNGSQRQDLTLDQTATAAAPASAPAAGVNPAVGRVNRIGQAYTSTSYKSHLLGQAEGRQVWGLDSEEIDWAMQNSDKIMDQDFQVSPSATGGLRVDNVVAGSFGAARGLMAGDIVKSVNDQPLNSITDIKALMNNQGVRQQTVLKITVERAGKPVVFEYRPLPR